MHKPFLRRLRSLVPGLATALCGVLATAQTLSPTLRSPEAPFLAENRAAMNKMMAAMSVEPSGDVDQDFAAMMIPHHRGAIDMAQSELRYGRNEQLRRIAQEIMVEQQQEIVAMRQALGLPLPPTTASPHQPRDLSGKVQVSAGQGGTFKRG